MRAALPLALFFCGCGRYADFALPAPDTAGPRAPFTWQAAPAPVLSRGLAKSWDSVDVLNPSVVRLNGFYLNLYSGFDGRAWRTGLATSADGSQWQKVGRMLSPEGWEGAYIAANGSALVWGGEILYWYVAGEPGKSEIGLARSRNGEFSPARSSPAPSSPARSSSAPSSPARSSPARQGGDPGLDWTRLDWKKSPKPVLAPGPLGSFDERAVADPDVIRRGDWFYMFYLGQDRAARQRLGLARSRDGAIWEKLRMNPILELGEPGSFDEMGLGEPAVWSSGGLYWMLYTGRDHGERRRVGLARSADGVRWDRETSFAPVGGAEAWDSQVMCDPSVEIQPSGAIRVWFGGGDVATPDHGLHGQIGVGVLTGR